MKNNNAMRTKTETTVNNNKRKTNNTKRTLM